MAAPLKAALTIFTVMQFAPSTRALKLPDHAPKESEVEQTHRDVRQHNASRTSAHVQAPTPTPACTADFVDQNLQGSDVQKVVVSGATSAELDTECCIQCRVEADCEFWIREASQCWLKRDATTFYSYAGLTGGYKAATTSKSPDWVGADSGSTTDVQFPTSNVCSGQPQNCGRNVMDGDPATVWHCDVYAGGCWIEFDLQSSRTVVGFNLLTVQNRFSGCELQYRLGSSSTWITAATLTPASNSASVSFSGIDAQLWRLSDVVSNAGWPAIAETEFIFNEQAHATGDPHMQNIHGERFDLMKPGKHVLIHIPRGVTADKALLRVQAVARRLGARCSDLYFQDINVTGKWTNSDLHYSAQVVADDTPQWTKFGPVELKVAHGHTEKGVKYLNFYVEHLGRAGAAVGGLLGEDDNAEAATPSAECRKVVSLDKMATRTAWELPGASVAIAAM